MFWVFKSGTEERGKMQENLSEFYSWVDKNIEIRLGRQRCCHLPFVFETRKCV